MPHPSSSEHPNTSSTEAHRVASAAKAETAATDLNCVINAIGDLGLDWDEIASQQALDPDFRRLRQEARSGLNFKSIDIGTRSLIVDVSNGPARPFIPFASRRKVFNCLHGLGHPGVERTRQIIAEKVVWPSMRADVSKWARECLACQRTKVIRHTVPPISDFVVPDKRFNHINMDLVSLPPSNGYRYLLTIVDRFTRWPVAVPLVDISTKSVLDGFAHGWVQSFGIPATITTDRGGQFTSTLFQQLTETWGIKTILTSAYHPEANGLVERLHRRLKEALLAADLDQPEEWYWRLPCVMLAIRTTLKPDVGASPSDLVYGEGLAVPGELLPPNPATEPQLVRQRAAALSDLRLEVSRLQPAPTSAHRRPQTHMPDALERCSHVFIRRAPVGSSVNPCLAAPYNGPFKVLSRNATNFKVALPSGRHEVVAIARIKPAVSSDLDAEDPDPPPRQPTGRSRQRHRRQSPTLRQQTPPPSANPQEQQTQSPPIRRRIPRGRARPLPDEDEDEGQPPQQPQPQPQLEEVPLDYDIPIDDVPDWQPPPWFDASPDWSADPEPEAEMEAEAPPPPPSPPPPPRPPPSRRRKHRGNPNWVKGGSFAGRYQRNFARDAQVEPEAPPTPPRPARGWRYPSSDEPAVTRQRRRPDVSAIFAHLGLSQE